MLDKLHVDPYEDALDECYRAVDACGGYGCPDAKDQALGDVLAAIEKLGGMDPAMRKREREAAIAKSPA
jgi:hypothetical protein